jgi:uncharacterized membrane protein
MAPLIIMLVAWVAFRIAGIAGFHAADFSIASLRFALAAMFIFTGVSHFVPRTRGEMIRMVPPALGHQAFFVTLTGVLELIGAVGLLVPSLVRPAAIALAALLIAMFPANVHASRAGLSVGGRRAMPLKLRLPLQLIWIGLLLLVGMHDLTEVRT